MKYIMLGCAFFLLVGTLNLPIGYYTFLRIMTTFGSIIIITNEAKKRLTFWVAIFGIIIILFNPLIPVYFKIKSIWITIDIICALIFIAKTLNLKQKSLKKMAQETLNEPPKTFEDSKITYSIYGFRSAQKSQSMPEGIDGYLNNVYDRFLEEQKLDEQGLKDRISKLKAELQQEKAKKNDASAEISSYKIYKEDKEKQIEELEFEKIEIRNGDGEIGNNSSFVIGAFITLMLTMYLFVFYSSSGYSAFYGIKKGSLGFINPNVFSEAINKGGGVIALIILFPVIFLAMGFYIHISIENNKNLVAKNKPSKYGGIVSLLFITLIADIFIGYKISEGIHTNEFNAGLTKKVWHFKMIFSDINFYLVLVLGFVVYVIWGFLLNFVLSHPYLKTENEKVKLMLENINDKIGDRRSELSDILSKIHKTESDIITIENKMEEKTKDIIGYENGMIPINISSLKAAVGEFMGGWQNYTYSNVQNEIAVRLNNEAINVQSLWLDKLIEKVENQNSVK